MENYVVLPGKYDKAEVCIHDWYLSDIQEIPIIDGVIHNNFFDMYGICLVKIYSGDNKKYGYLRSDGTWLVEPIFDYAISFYAGNEFAYVRKDDEKIVTGYVDRSGTLNWVAPIDWDVKFLRNEMLIDSAGMVINGVELKKDISPDGKLVSYLEPKKGKRRAFYKWLFKILN